MKEGLAKDGQLIPWKQMGDVEIFEGSFIVRKRDGGAFSGPLVRVEVADVPNFAVFLTLVKRCCQEA